MKILHFSSAKTWRGGEQQIAYLYEELDKKGVKQWIFCPQKSALANFCIINKIAHITYHKRFSTNPLVAYQLKELCKKLALDLVHLHDSHSHSFAFISTFLGNKTPFVLSRRVDFPVKKSWFSYKKYNHPAIKKILSVSNYVQTILAPAIADKSKLQVVHSGIDLTRFKHQQPPVLRQEYNIPKSTKVIANIAAIAPHKDYFTFVNTAELLLKKQSNLKFFIIGENGGEEQKISAYIKQKRLERAIILTGFRKDIPQILPDIDVFLFTSKEEGLGTTILDAMACGVPIVATAAGGVSELIQHQHNGFLVPIKAAAQLAKYVEKVLENTTIKERFTQNSKDIIQQFSKEKTAQKTFEVYHNSLSKP